MSPTQSDALPHYGVIITIILAVLEAILAVTCIAAQAVVIDWSMQQPICKFYIYILGDVVPEDGSGIWVGGLYLIHAIILVVTAKKNNFGMLIISFVMSVICGVLTFILIGLSANHISEVKDMSCSKDLDNAELAFALDNLMIACGVLLFLASLVFVILALRTACGCCNEETLITRHYFTSPEDSHAADMAASNQAYQSMELEQK